MLDDPPFCAWAQQFCDTLQRRQFKKAHRFFSPDLAKQISPAQLKKHWLSMIMPYGDDSDDNNDGEVDIYLLQHEICGDDGEANYIGWCYFVVSNQHINEAIAMTTYQSEVHHGYEIRAIEFGRP